MALAGQPSGVAFTPDGVWVSFAPAGIARVDPSNLSVTLTQSVGNGPTAVLSAFGLDLGREPLRRHRLPARALHRTVQATISVGEGPNALGAAAGSLWVANEFDDSITAIDPTTDTTSSQPSRWVARQRRSRPTAMACGSPSEHRPQSTAAGP